MSYSEHSTSVKFFAAIFRRALSILIISIFFVLLSTNILYAASGSITKTDNPWGWPNIPDPGTVTRTITVSSSDVPAGAQITSVNFKCYIDHPYWGDIKIKYGISNRSVEWSYSSGSGKYLVDKTEYTEFDGQNPAQTWTMYLTDRYSLDQGEYDYWEITIYYTYTPPKPDLIVQDISISPTSPTAGQSATITATLKNQGNANASGSIHLKYYVDGGYIGDDYLSYGLGAGSSNNESISYTAGSAGNHTVMVAIDTENIVSESNESNNNRSETYYWNSPPQPDLIAYSASVSDTTVDPGQGVTVYWTAKNQGTGSAGSTQQGVMWSSNSTISRSDTLLEKEYLGSMSVNQTSPEAHTINIPANATPGQTYYLGAYADYDLGEDEGSNENNNGSNGVAVTVNYPPETITTPNTLSGPSLGYTGQSLSFSTGGSTSNLGHSVQYSFDWGDGSYSPWGSPTQSKTYSDPGPYIVKAQARCQTHTSVFSSWSSAKAISISEPTVTIVDAWIKSGTWVDNDGDGYARALTLEWDATVSYGTMDVYANVRSDSWNRLERDLGNTTSYTLGTNATRKEFIVPVDAKDLDHTTWDFQVDLYETGTSTRVARLSMGGDPQLNDVKIELSSEDVFEPGIISAYWWMPLDVSTGDEVTMFAEVENIPVDAQCTFQVFEDDGVFNDPILPTLTGSVYTGEGGKTYVKATWTAQWQNDGGIINPWAADPEYFFEVSYDGVSLKSSTSANHELMVRNDRQEPSTDHGDFYYSTGEATQNAALTDSRIPIILVHGASGDRKIDSLNYWYGWVNGDMAPTGAQLGRFNENDMKSMFRVYRYVYDSRRQIRDNGQEFAAFLNQFYQSNPAFSERQVVIMAHSMGGLVTRYALNTNSDFRSKVHRVITLGTPHLGSPLANPSWVRQESPNESLKEIMFNFFYYSNFGGTQGDFDLAWYNTSNIPSSARLGGVYYQWIVDQDYFNKDLLDASLSTPFCGSSNMIVVSGDNLITAYGGHFISRIVGQGPDWPETVAEEVITHGITDHSGLHTLRNALHDMNFDDGTNVDDNDGMVPLTSALLGSGHTNAEKINLTQSQEEAIDHSSYLDVASTMQYVAHRLNTMVKVTISPLGAIDAGARWRIVGGAWQKSGVSLNCLTPGQHTIEFKDVSGWTKPSNQTVPINDGQTTTGNGTYTEVMQSGSLQVTITPQGAIDAGAQWRVDGGAWHNSGYTQSGLSVGSHTVEFSSVTGWAKPGNQTVTINESQTTTTSGIYTQQTGSLQVTISPQGAIDAGAQWRVDGGTWRNSGYTQSGLSIANHTVEFKSITGWTKPGNKTVTINDGQTANTTGTYTPTNNNWPMFHHDTANTGFSPDTNVPAQVEEVWRYYCRGGYSPAIADGIVYFGASNMSGDDVIALDADTGLLIWSYNFGGTAYVDATAPAVDNGSVYVTGSKDSKANGTVYSFDAATGSVKWSYLIGDYIFKSSPKPVDGKVYFGTDDNKVYCLNASNGSLVWSYATASSVRSTPAIVNGIVYIGSDDQKCYALNANTGNLIWSYDTGNDGYGGSIQNAPAVANGKVYFRSSNYFTYCLNASNGSVIWKRETSGPAGSVAIAYGNVYIADYEGMIYGLNADNGNINWSYSTGTNIASSPVIANNVLYIVVGGDYDANLMAFNASNGTLLWNIDIGSRSFISSVPAIADGKIFVADKDAYLYAFGSVLTAGTPSSITVPSSDSDGSYTVSWGSSSTSSVTYVLQEATNSSFSSGLRTAYSGSSTSTTITGRSSGTTYYYRVKETRSGYNDSAWRTGSNGCTVTITSTAGTPSSITVPSSDSDGSYTVSWGASSTSSVTYVLQEATNSSFSNGLRTAYSGSSTGTTITGRSSGTTYFYRVKATRSGYNDSAWRTDTNGCTVTITPPDTTPPSPDAMAWGTEPSAATSTSMSMVATTATDSESPPVTYFFDFVDSPTGGSGGSDRDWESSTSYADSRLQPNHQYGYRVKARDSASTPNETGYSSTVYKYTHANAPGTAAFSNVTQTAIRANWTDNGNRAGTEYYCENITEGTNSGWITNTYWDSTGLTAGAFYTFRVKARNGDGVETSWTHLGSQSTLTCSSYVIYVNKDDGTCGGKNPCYGTIQEAIDAACTGTNIRITQGTYGERFVLNSSKVLTIKGGWNSAFTSQTSNTTFIKAPKAPQGSLTLQMVTIRP